VAAGLCYVLGLVTGVIFLVIEPYNRNREVRFHAFQSIFLHIAWIAVWIVMIIFGGVFGHIVPILGHLISAAIWMVMGLGVFVLWVVLLVKTFSGGKIVLPVIGPLAEKQAG
jgi:uncharacterized membrane protein